MPVPWLFNDPGQVEQPPNDPRLSNAAHIAPLEGTEVKLLGPIFGLFGVFWAARVGARYEEKLKRSALSYEVAPDLRYATSVAEVNGS